MSKYKKRVSLLSLIATTIVILLAVLTQRGELTRAYIKSIVDGDTVKAETQGKTYTVRLIGVNTPETNHPTKGVEPYGPEAKEFTKKTLTGKTVWLEFDTQEKDKYGRLLAYVWLEKPNDNSENEIKEKMFNAILVLEGYAQVMTVPPNVKYADYFVKFQREAIENQKGLWSLKVYNSKIKKTDSYDQIEQSDVKDGEFLVYISKGGKKYHLKDCRYVNDNYEPITIEEAKKKGLTPCDICKPDEEYQRIKNKTSF